MIRIHSFNSLAIHTNVRHPKVMFLKVIYQPYKYQSSYPISGIKSTEENKNAVLTRRMHFIFLLWVELVSITKRSHTKDELFKHVHLPYISSTPNLTLHPWWLILNWPCLITKTITHLPAKLLHCACIGTKQNTGLWGEVVIDDTEIMFLRYSL